ncbi:YqgQ family protein [Leuconostoc miyukkimchii]|uniref:YqgQ family protein n=1 Tax=Leuconostoc miyukkimchii TaxID=910540 RepID=UPI001C7D69BE|nr:YqgQ family protein [Leuconostoc miyukkimchii]
MKNFYDILTYLKAFGIYIHLGKRLWDIEMAALEVDNLQKAGIIDNKKYATMKVILAHEHRLEEENPSD